MAELVASLRSVELRQAEDSYRDVVCTGGLSIASEILWANPRFGDKIVEVIDKARTSQLVSWRTSIQGSLSHGAMLLTRGTGYSPIITLEPASHSRYPQGLSPY